MDIQARDSQSSGGQPEKQVEVLVYWKHDLQQILGDEVITLSAGLSMNQFGERLAEVFKDRINAEQGKYLVIRKFNSKFDRFVTMKMDETDFLVDSAIFDVSPLTCALAQDGKVALYEIPAADQVKVPVETAYSETMDANVKNKEDLPRMVKESFCSVSWPKSSPSVLQIVSPQKEFPEKESVGQVKSSHAKFSFPSMVSLQPDAPSEPKEPESNPLMDHPLIANLFSKSDGVSSSESVRESRKPVRIRQKLQRPSAYSPPSSKPSRPRSNRSRSPSIRKNSSSVGPRGIRKRYSPKSRWNCLKKEIMPIKLLDRMKAEITENKRDVQQSSRSYVNKRHHSPFDPFKQKKRSNYEKFLDRNASPSSSKESGELSREPSPVQWRSGLVVQKQPNMQMYQKQSDVQMYQRQPDMQMYQRQPGVQMYQKQSDVQMYQKQPDEQMVRTFHMQQQPTSAMPSPSGRVPLLPTQPSGVGVRPAQSFCPPATPSVFAYGHPEFQSAPSFFPPPNVRYFQSSGSPVTPHMLGQLNSYQPHWNQKRY